MQWLCRHCAEEVQLRLLLQVLVCHQFFLTWDLQEREIFLVRGMILWLNHHSELKHSLVRLKDYFLFCLYFQRSIKKINRIPEYTTGEIWKFLCLFCFCLFNLSHLGLRRLDWWLNTAWNIFENQSSRQHFLACIVRGILEDYFPLSLSLFFCGGLMRATCCRHVECWWCPLVE